MCETPTLCMLIGPHRLQMRREREAYSEWNDNLPLLPSPTANISLSRTAGFIATSVPYGLRLWSEMAKGLHGELDRRKGQALWSSLKSVCLSTIGFALLGSKTSRSQRSRYFQLIYGEVLLFLVSNNCKRGLLATES